MIEQSDLPGSNLPDGTAASQRTNLSGQNVSASEVREGFKALDSQRPSIFDDGSGEDPKGDAFTFGGFLGRPRGTAR